MNETSRSERVKHPDPSALGLLGLAIVTLVASSQKLDITQGTSLVIPWAIFLGALGQISAGILDFKKSNVFGATAFLSYGFFWLGTAMTWSIMNGVFGETMAANADVKQLGFAFLGYFIFSAYMTIGSMETNKVLFVIFSLITLLFLNLFLSTMGFIPEVTHQIAAFSELFISIFAFYASAANVLNHQFEKTFLPLGKPFGIFK